MMPKMPINFPRVRQLIFGPTTMVPASVQDEITQMVIGDVVGAYSYHLKGLPEYSTIYHSKNCRKIDCIKCTLYLSSYK